ncbi:hypothetical protein QP228_008210 [Pseudoglutamicibacter cumminsii]|uniref:hypothetical protein n=1 Tax=Pseudoglutamicibacter cumminsii TaxID=156979 RepID=UPI002555692D|nr:hypothetical protein [Pseudoglutamicibacter cumminsii]MDZ3745954.1 hypothetical protein [Pseudoglutamicibacter cumminsii]
MADEQKRRSPRGAGQEHGKNHHNRGGHKRGYGASPRGERSRDDWKRGERGGRDERWNRGDRRRDDRPGRSEWKRDERDNRQDRSRGEWNRDERGGRDERHGHGRRRDDRRKDRQRNDRQHNERNRPQGRRGGDIRAANRPDRERSPEIDPSVTGNELDKETLRELRFLDEKHRPWVAKHLVMAGALIDVDPELAFAHAEAASRRGGRVALVREAVGLTAYAAGKYSEALRELRTHRRISGIHDHIATIADCERALGRVDKALETLRSDEAKALKGQPRAEAAMVEAGILLDASKNEEAVKALQIPTLDMNRAFIFSPRLFELYADALEAIGQAEEAAAWRARIPVAMEALGLNDVEPEIVDLVEDEADAAEGEAKDEAKETEVKDGAANDAEAKPSGEGAAQGEAKDGETSGEADTE